MTGPINPYYPYTKVVTGANTMRGAEEIPYKLLMYLLDLPDASGYEPPDNNDYPRCRLSKYLWYDGARPLDNPVPTPEQKTSLIFNPNEPVTNADDEKLRHPKGYRLLWQRVRGQSQLEAETFIRCYLGRCFEARKYITTIGIRFDVICNVNFDANTGTTAYSRAIDIEMCIHDALDGVDISGAGAISFFRQEHSDNGSGPLSDEYTNVGRWVHCSLPWAE